MKILKLQKHTKDKETRKKMKDEINNADVCIVITYNRTQDISCYMRDNAPNMIAISLLEVVKQKFLNESVTDENDE